MVVCVSKRECVEDVLSSKSFLRETALSMGRLIMMPSVAKVAFDVMGELQYATSPSFFPVL